MMNRVPVETELIQCPYDKSHRIMRQRFQVHLVRCRKNYPLSEVVTCPFNVTHRFNKQELNWHVTICPERKTFEHFRHRDEPIAGLSSTVDSSFSGDNVRQSDQYKVPKGVLLSEENWDDDPDVPTYDPKVHAESSAVLRMPVGLSPAERREFRAAERQRLLNLMK